MSDLFIPFNHQPVSTQRGTGTYTCPAGKYARVTVSMAGSAYTSNIHANGTTSAGAGSSDSFNKTFHIWVKTSDTVAFSAQETANSATGSGLTGTTSDRTYIEVHYNGAIISSCVCHAFAYHNTAAVGVSNVSGSLDYNWYSEEYNELT